MVRAVFSCRTCAVTKVAYLSSNCLREISPEASTSSLPSSSSTWSGLRVSAFFRSFTLSLPLRLLSSRSKRWFAFVRAVRWPLTSPCSSTLRAFSMTVSYSPGSALTSRPYAGIIRESAASHGRPAELNFLRTSIAICGLTLAPGDAPSRPTIVPSSDATTSVPNWSCPEPCASGLTIWIRWPAQTIVQSSGLASGTNSRSARSCCSFDEKTSKRRYLTSGRLRAAIAAIGSTLPGLNVESQSSGLPPTLKMVGLKPANGPKKMQS
mmetsp:Transcript_19316/g.32779  ORF Transcript_19316/g.32779 Transcript_19316/m.32779 type:complete len:266 (-) Transcript_19316:330-1127(-)